VIFVFSFLFLIPGICTTCGIIIIIINTFVSRHKVVASVTGAGAMQRVSEQRKKRKPGKTGMSLAKT